MPIVRNADQCPKCGHEFLTRIPRRWWMRLFGIHRHLRCQRCSHQVMYRPHKRARRQAHATPSAAHRR